MGRRSDPAELHLLRGTLRKRQPKKVRAERATTDASAPSTPATEWEAPAHVPTVIARIWGREMLRLRSAGYIKPSDLAAFEIYLSARYRWERAQAVVLKRGMTYQTDTKHGSMERQRPEIKIMEVAERTMKAFMDGLAMTTGSRIRAGAQLAGQQGNLPFAEPGAPRPKEGADHPVPTSGPIGLLTGGSSVH